MFKFASATFPESQDAPKFLYKAVLIQKVNEHEIMVLSFKDWTPLYDTIKPGSPVKVTISGNSNRRDFVGYVHHLQPSLTPGEKFTEVVCIGGSFPMKQASQKTYRDHTADQVIRQMAIKHKLNYVGQPHPRVYELISQAGYTDWQLAVRLAKQCGYTLRVENTDLYFEPILNDYETYRDQAMHFVLRESSDIRGSNLYSFQPLVGDSIEYEGEMKAAVAVSGVDRFSKVPMSQTKQKRNKTTKIKRQDEFFDRFNSLAVTPNPSIAKFEAEAAEARNSFPYRGVAEVLGDPSLRPNMPVYISGVGRNYSGYWTILGTEHILVESERNAMSYTTSMTLGTDSLGSSQSWKGTPAYVPEATAKRTIKPGIKQKGNKSTPKLQVKAIKANNKNTGSFGKINNRAKVTKNVKVPSVWKSSSPTPTAKFVEKKVKSTTVVDRKLKAGRR